MGVPAKEVEGSAAKMPVLAIVATLPKACLRLTAHNPVHKPDCRAVEDKWPVGLLWVEKECNEVKFVRINMTVRRCALRDVLVTIFRAVLLA